MPPETVAGAAVQAPFVAADARGDREQVSAIVRAAGTSFFWAMRLLPSDKRHAMYAVYAFCRAVDDIADEPCVATEVRLARLDAWREEITALFDGLPRHPITRVLLPAVERGITEECDYRAVIDGMETDARGPVRRPSRAELTLYCDRVAGAVGRLSVAIFGEAGPEGREVARHQGQALQLTNILRDLDEDAAQGRLYLPDELLTRHGITGEEPAAVLAHPALDAACRDLAGEAARAFAEAQAATASCDRRAMRPAIIMREVYRLTLGNLQARGWHDRRRPCKPTKRRMLRIALRHGLL